MTSVECCLWGEVLNINKEKAGERRGGGELISTSHREDINNINKYEARPGCIYHKQLLHWP